MKIGFTGSRKGTELSKVKEVLDSLNLTKNDTIITGACIGIDTLVSTLTRPYKCNQIIIVPANRSNVNFAFLATLYPEKNTIIYMDAGTSYRDRNEKIVETSELLIAFWDGNRRSGTYMTMNLARRANKLIRIIKI
jgi:hypothetical protein